MVKIIIAIIIPLFLFLVYWSQAMYNPFKTILIVGKKGSGKSTDIIKKCLQYHGRKFWYYDKDEKIFHRWKKAEWRIYTNMKVNLPFRVYKLDVKKLGDLIPKPFSVLLIDEINLYFDNRKFKEFKESTQEFYRLARKYRCKVIMYSQTFDTDKKIRDLTDEMWLYQNKLGVFGWCKKISKVPDIRENGLSAENQLVDVIKFESILTPKSRQLTWLPKYIKYFDSYENMNNKPYYPDDYYPLVKYGNAKKVYIKHSKTDIKKVALNE